MHTTTQNHEEPEDGSTAGLEREATEWFFRRDGGLTAEEETALTRWLREDDRHARAFAKIEATWGTLREARDKVLTAEIQSAPLPRRARSIPWIPAGLAAAAAIIAIGAIGWWRPAPSGLRFSEQVENQIGGMRKYELPEGSYIVLNANSAMRVEITAAERRVRLLRGEAFFSVARDPRRPFVVEGLGVAVTAVGTMFNVRLGLEAVEVIVTEGKVRVGDTAKGESLVSMPPIANEPSLVDGAAEGLLHAGRKIVIPVQSDAAPRPAVAAPIASSDIDRALAWQQVRLDYVDAPLSEIIADFNRYNQHRLVIADPRLGDRRFGGIFQAGDYRSLVQLLEKTFGVSVERRERETVLRLP
ncbi:MAG: FecR family protein [Opitutaceae bacterium]